MYISLNNSESLGNSKNTSLRQTFATSPNPLVAPSTLLLYVFSTLFNNSHWVHLRYIGWLLLPFCTSTLLSLLPIFLFAVASYSNTGFLPSYTRQYQRESKNRSNSSRTEEGLFTDIWYFSRNWRKR